PVHEAGAAAGVFESSRGRSRVARGDNRSVRCLETVSECLQLTVRDGERRHLYVRVLIDGTGFNLMHVRPETCRVRVLEPFRSSLNIRLICLDEMVCHGWRSRRTIDLEWFVPSHNPRRQHDISQPERVVGMQMGNESDL